MTPHDFRLFPAPETTPKRTPFSRPWLLEFLVGMIVGIFCTLFLVAQARADIPVNVDSLAPPPSGWHQFCRDYRAECNVPTLPAVGIEFSNDAYHKLKKINDYVNRTIKPLTDEAHHGRIEQWGYPTDGVGDCEDYVLVKRRMLMEAGLPRQALLITVVLDQRGEGHAVLMVITNRGHMILDNATDRIMPAEDTGYVFVKRQAQENPNTWRYFR